jgi:hypothetical protein
MIINKIAKNKIIMVTTDKAVLSANSINEVLNSFRDPAVGCVTGRPISLNPKNTLFGYWSHLLLYAGAHRIRKELSLQEKFFECTNYLFAFKNIFQKPFWSFFRKLTPAPQIKMRTFEAAFCKSLILCRKDDFNVIENFFEKDKEFIYYKDKKEMEIIIKDVLSNYDKYIPIIENAFNKAVNHFTTKKFAEKYLSQI